MKHALPSGNSAAGEGPKQPSSDSGSESESDTSKDLDSDSDLGEDYVNLYKVGWLIDIIRSILLNPHPSPFSLRSHLGLIVRTGP